MNFSASRNSDEMRGMWRLGLWLRLAMTGVLVTVAAIVSLATGETSASSGLIGAAAGSLLAVVSGRKFFGAIGNEPDPSTSAPALAHSRVA
jgi:hypothetical protein